MVAEELLGANWGKKIRKVISAISDTLSYVSILLDYDAMVKRSNEDRFYDQILSYLKNAGLWNGRADTYEEIDAIIKAIAEYMEKDQTNFGPFDRLYCLGELKMGLEDHREEIYHTNFSLWEIREAIINLNGKDLISKIDSLASEYENKMFDYDYQITSDRYGRLVTAEERENAWSSFLTQFDVRPSVAKAYNLAVVMTMWKEIQNSLR